ncbi:MAG: CRISPR-associated helicase Cas3' [Nitrospira sp.]|nr:CRISPR-associated helicase Cas3' [Nitrospira sp.]
MEEPLYIAHRRKTDGAQQSLERHLLEVAELSKIFASKLALAEHGELIGLVHDLGKYSKEFQTYLKSAVGLLNQDEDEDFVDAKGLRGKVDHSTAGAQLVWKEITKQGKIGEIVGQILALCIASHHSGLIDCLSSGSNSPVEDNFKKRINKSDCRTHLRQASSNMDDSISRRFSMLANGSRIVDGLKKALGQIALLDEIKGLDPRSNLVVQFKIGLLVRFLFSCLIDADRTNTADFEKPKAAKHRPAGPYLGWNILIERLEKVLKKFENQKEINRLRKQISDHCKEKASATKGIYTLTVPTGGGKTLASLRFALHHAQKWGMDRIIYVLPFTTIIDQNAEVVRSILEPSEKDRGRIVLEHHSNLTPEQQRWQEKILTENWDAPVIYTTSVQLLESLFGAGTRGARRMHQLANAVLIFDEIQTIPVNCVHLFNNAINFLVEHCGTTAVLCTATQPLLNQVDKNKGALHFRGKNEIMPDVKRLFDDLKRVEVLNRHKPGGWTNEEIAALAFEEVRNSGSCLVIVNTKKSAQKLFEICLKNTETPIYHLSTNMCPSHRKDILERIREFLTMPDSPVLCVSTQLIEAGVDIDFGAVIRFTAGLDSVAQAAGRCNRNKLRDVGRVHVINPVDESLDMLKDIRSGIEVTQRLLNEAMTGEWEFDGNLLGPEAMERYFNYYFFSRRNEMSYSMPAKTIGREDTLLNLLSVNSASVEEYRRSYREAPNIYLCQSFMSAAKAFKVIDAPARGIIVPYKESGRELINDLCSAIEVEKKLKLLRLAQQYTVNVFPHVLDQLQEEGAANRIREGIDIFYLSDTRYYSQTFGLSQTPEGDMEVYCV